MYFLPILIYTLSSFKNNATSDLHFSIYNYKNQMLKAKKRK